MIGPNAALPLHLPYRTKYPKIFANSYDFNVKEFSLCLISLIIFDVFFWLSIKDNKDGLYWYYHKIKNNSEKDYGVKLKLKLSKKYFFRVA